MFPWSALKATSAMVVRKGNHAARVTHRPTRALLFDPHLHATYCVVEQRCVDEHRPFGWKRKQREQMEGGRRHEKDRQHARRAKNTVGR